MSEKRAFGFWDLTLYAVSMQFGVRWLAVAAVTGAASLPLWAVAAALFLIPLSIAASELTGRFPEEGAIYAWTRDTYGHFAGFVCGWIYWVCNIPFFAGLLVFIANLLAIALGPEHGAILTQPAALLAFSVLVSVAVALLHGAGLDVGKWVSVFSAGVTFVIVAVLIYAAIVLSAQRGSATDFVHADYAPPLNADTAILWATMVFGYGGAEGVALLRNNVRGGMPVVVRVLMAVAVLLAIGYVVGTSAILAIMPAAQASRLSGLPDALTFALTQLGAPWLAPLILVALAFVFLGAYSAWFGVAARLPYAAGLDRDLPKAFAKQSKSGAPIVAIGFQTISVIVLVALSQAGATLKGAYDYLSAMTILSFTLPYAFLFAVYLKVQKDKAADGVWTTPGGAGVARWIGRIAIVATWSAILCNLVPTSDTADKMGAVVKLVTSSAVLILGGAAIYVLNHRRRATDVGAE